MTDQMKWVGGQIKEGPLPETVFVVCCGATFAKGSPPRHFENCPRHRTSDEWKAIADASPYTVTITSTGPEGFIVSNGNVGLGFTTNGREIFRLPADGRLGPVGTVAPETQLEVSGALTNSSPTKP